MAKKKQSKKKEEKKDAPAMPMLPAKPGMPPIPKEVQAKLKAIKVKLDKFTKEITKKFDKYIIGVSLLPPPRPKEGEKVDKDKINVLVLVDDTDSQRMSKFELKNKLTTIIDKLAHETDKNLFPQVVILSELWQSCYDGKYDVLRMVASSAPVYDTGMLSAIKIAEIHKEMVLKKFEKYIVSYVLAGSLVQGRATKTSDIDVWIVIDDTDVKKMTRAELKDKLRAIIIGMGLEAGDITGIKNKLNIQVYILTDFWDSLKEANPIIFTLLRDGVPFYDRGVFMPWKLLLKMGKIKPSAEAIDMFMNSGEQMLKRVHFKLKDIGMEDIFYALLTPSQAALMLYGVPPPTPRETPEVMRELFVKKGKLIEDKYVQILERVIAVRKDIEHGTKDKFTGKEVDELLKDAEEYLARIKKLFEQIEKTREEDSLIGTYDTVITVIRDILKMEGKEKIAEQEIVKVFEDELVTSGKVPSKFIRSLNSLVAAKKDYEAKKLTKTEVGKIRKESGELIRFLVEYMQRKRGKELDRVKIKVKYGEKYGEIMLLGNTAFVIADVDKKDKEIQKATLNPDGSIGHLTMSTLEELEKYLVKIRIPDRVFIHEPVFESLKKIFGKHVEVLMHN